MTLGQEMAGYALMMRQSAKALQLELAQMPDALQMAYRDSAPNVICAYAYELAGAVNRFYHETRILAEPDKQKQAGYLALIRLARRALEPREDPRAAQNVPRSLCRRQTVERE